MENFTFVVSISHPSYNHWAPHVSLGRCFRPASYIRKESKKLHDLRFLSNLQITHQADLQVIVAFYHMTLFALSTASQTPLVKEQTFSWWRLAEIYIRHPHACRKCKLLRAPEPSDTAEEKVTYCTWSPGDGNAWRWQRGTETWDLQRESEEEGGKD